MLAWLLLHIESVWRGGVYMKKISTDGRNTCRWIKDADNVWYSNCQSAMTLLMGYPDDNQFFYCNNCGRPIAYTLQGGVRKVPAHDRDGVTGGKTGMAMFDEVEEVEPIQVGRPMREEPPMQNVEKQTEPNEPVEDVEQSQVEEETEEKQSKGGLLDRLTKSFSKRKEKDEQTPETSTPEPDNDTSGDDIIEIYYDEETNEYVDANGQPVDISEYDIETEDESEYEVVEETIKISRNSAGEYFTEDGELIPTEDYAEYGIDEPVEQLVEETPSVEETDMTEQEEMPDFYMDDDGNIVDEDGALIDLAKYGLTKEDFIEDE